MSGFETISLLSLWLSATRRHRSCTLRPHREGHFMGGPQELKPMRVVEMKSFLIEPESPVQSPVCYHSTPTSMYKWLFIIILKNHIISHFTCVSHDGYCVYNWKHGIKSEYALFIESSSVQPVIPWSVSSPLHPSVCGLCLHLYQFEHNFQNLHARWIIRT